MKKVLSMLLALTILICLSVPAMADATPDSGYFFYIEINGLSNTSGTDTGSVTRVSSDTPSCLLEKPSNLTTEREGQTYLGLFCKANSKTYQFGDTLLLEDFVPYQDGYRIQLQAMYTDPVDPDVNYTDVDEYLALLDVVSPIEYDNVVHTFEFPYDPTTDTNIGEAEYNFSSRTQLGRFLIQHPVEPEGYRSLITGNVFYLGDTFDLDKLPAPESAGTTTREISPTEAERIHSYVITDTLVPLYSFNGVTGAFLDPLYECKILYYVPSPLSNSTDINAPLGTVATQTVTGITMEEMTAPDYAITLNNAPNYDGYIFKGYSLLTETEVTVPDDHIIYLNDLEYMNDSPGHIRLSMKLHYSIDPDYTGLQNTVTYAPNNGSLPVSGSAPADPNLYSLGTPFPVMGQGTLAIDGYEFIGWNTKADGSGTMYHENDMAPMTEDGILYAQWKPEGSVLVSMNGNGGAFGSETSKELYMIPNTAFADAEGYEEPTREGYDFNGWASTPNAADADITAVPSTDNTAIYAVWARKTDVKVTFDALNGSSPTEETGAFEASLTVPSDPTRTGYSFGGWNTKADGTGDALPDPAVFPGKDTIYYAQWIPNEITVKFLPGEGGNIISGTAETKLHTGETLGDVAGFTFPEIETNNPYTFLGWRSNSGEFYDAAHDTAQIVMNHIFTGAQDPEIFTAEYSKLGQTQITFDYAGGTDSDGATYKSFTDYEYTRFDESLVPTPSRAGYIFKGWDAEIPTEYPVLGNTITLHALWEDARHIVTFEMNGHGTAPEEQRVIDGNTVSKPTDPTAEGWTFDGWYADATFSVAFDFNTAINADTTIYAKWTENTPPAPTYTIIVGANGEWAKGSTTGLAFTSDAPFAKFDGVKVDGSTIAATNYTAEEGSTKITLAPTYLETLSVGSHSIVVVSTDGSASTNFTVKSAAIPPVPTTYTVTFNMNGHGTQITAQTVKEGEKASKPADPTASGYTFGGWYADATCSTKFDFNSAITANTTVYAKWTKTSVTPTDPTSPQTGDNSNMFLWIALLFVSGGALVGTAVYGKKKKYRAE